MARPNTWRADEEQITREMWNAGGTQPQIARRLGRTPSQVASKVTTMGLRGTPRRRSRTPLSELPTAGAILLGLDSAATAKDPLPLASAAGLPPSGAVPGPAVLFSPPPAIVAPPKDRPVSRTRECIWISGDRPQYITCSELAMPGKPFCEAHCRRGYVRGSSLDDRRREHA